MTAGVAQLYRSVIDDVILNVREAFLDEGVDEQVLMELKQVWESKLLQSKAVPSETMQHEQDHGISTQFTLPQHHQATSTSKVAQRNPSLTQHLAAGNVVQYRYPDDLVGARNDNSKTVTITLPQTGTHKPVTIALPTIMQQGGSLVMSTPATAAAQALPPTIAAGLLQPSLTALNTGVITQQNSGPFMHAKTVQPTLPRQLTYLDGTTVSYQALTAEQLAKQGYTICSTQPSQQAAPVQQVQISNNGGIIQLDGAHDTSDDDDDEDDFKDDDNDQDNDDEQNDEDNDLAGEEEEPLNTDDDVSDEDPSELFDTDNVIVCQYDKITRSRNKWKFHLKDGIMNLNGKDYVFQRASGDAEW